MVQVFPVPDHWFGNRGMLPKQGGMPRMVLPVNIDILHYCPMVFPEVLIIRYTQYVEGR